LARDKEYKGTTGPYSCKSRKGFCDHRVVWVKVYPSFTASLYTYKREIKPLVAGYMGRGVNEYNREARAK